MAGRSHHVDRRNSEHLYRSPVRLWLVGAEKRRVAAFYKLKNFEAGMLHQGCDRHTHSVNDARQGASPASEGAEVVGAGVMGTGVVGAGVVGAGVVAVEVAFSAPSVGEQDRCEQTGGGGRSCFKGWAWLSFGIWHSMYVRVGRGVHPRLGLHVLSSPPGNSLPSVMTHGASPVSAQSPWLATMPLGQHSLLPKPRSPLRPHPTPPHWLH